MVWTALRGLNENCLCESGLEDGVLFFCLVRCVVFYQIMWRFYFSCIEGWVQKWNMRRCQCPTILSYFCIFASWIFLKTKKNIPAWQSFPFPVSTYCSCPHKVRTVTCSMQTIWTYCSVIIMRLKLGLSLLMYQPVERHELSAVLSLVLLMWNVVVHFPLRRESWFRTTWKACWLANCKMDVALCFYRLYNNSNCMVLWVLERK